jgi:ABC transport system ATP-binding/permease protein
VLALAYARTGLAAHSRVQVRVDGREAVFGAALAEVAVGADRSCLVRLHHKRVAPRHLLLRNEDSAWFVMPIGTAQVFLHGRRIERREIDEPLELRLADPEVGPLIMLAPAPEDNGGGLTLDWTATGARARPAPEAPERRPTSFQLPDSVLRIGRDPGSDVVVDDVLVSRRHAEIRPLGEGRYEVADLDSANGTFVNGRKVHRAELEQRDVVMVGRNAYQVIGEALEEYVDTGDVAFAARDLTVRLPNGTVLLDRVSFSLASRSLMAVVGPSGSGKSTLLNALTGTEMAGEGDVLYDDRSLYAAYAALRRRIGYVPQDDLVHRELTVRRALEFAAEIRFPPDVGADELRDRVESVIGQLGLADRAETRIDSLSGGQRKRASVGLELLTGPSLLFLDEPTSGLDPHFERSLMELFRTLADGGRTVIVTTHSMESLALCDRILVLAPHGEVAFFGPPQLMAAYFDTTDPAQVFTRLTESDEQDWGERFRRHPHHREYVEREAVPAPVEAPAPADSRLSRSRGWWRQFSTLTRRQAAVMVADRRNLALLVLQAPLLGLLMLAALPAGELSDAPPSELRLVSQAGLVLLVIALGITWLGMSNAIREIPKERALYRRERAAGLSISAYLASKVTVLGLVVSVQAAVLLALATARQHGPDHAAATGWPFGELLIVGALTGLAATTIGLLVSVLAKTQDRATTLLPVVLIFELVLALGGIFPNVADTPVVSQLTYVDGARWGFAGTAATADLNNLQTVTGVLTRERSAKVDDPAALFSRFGDDSRGDRLWDHTAGAWLGDTGALVALTCLALLATALALRRADPGRRRG